MGKGKDKNDEKGKDKDEDKGKDKNDDKDKDKNKKKNEEKKKAKERKKAIKKKLKDLGLVQQPSQEILLKGFCVSLALDLALEHCASDLLTQHGLPPGYDDASDDDYYHYY